MTPLRRRSLRLLAGAAPLALVVTTASAQSTEPPKQLPPVEVVATRIAERPHDVPASIEVITGSDIRARGARTLRDALALSAGVAIAPGGDGGPASSVPEFWGLREFDAFLLVVDNIPWGGALNPALASLSLRDVERIEVLRGAAPVTYGATSFVGVIHVVHTPAAAAANYYEAHGGTYGTGGGSASVSLFNGAWTSRLSADLDREGFKDNRTSFERGHALWQLSRGDAGNQTWFRSDVTYLLQDPASPHPREGAGLSTNTPLDANYNPAGAFFNDLRFLVGAGFERPIMDGTTWATTATFTHAGSNEFRGFLTDISNTPNNVSGFKRDIEISDAYADTHIIWPTFSNIKVMTGADLLFAVGKGKGGAFLYTAPLDGSSATAVTEPTILNLESEDGRIFLGGYASAEWRPVSGFTLEGGVRLNSTSERHDEAGPTTTNTKLSGSLGVLFGLWESGSNHVRLFANYRNTFKPAAFDFGLAENEAVLQPETSQSYEGGFKVSAAEGWFDAEISAFQMDFKNLVTPTIVNNLPALINAGQTRFKGFEVATDVRLAPGVIARGSYSYHDGKFVDFVQEFGGVPTQLAGNRFEMSANHMFSAGLTYSADEGFIGSAGLNYTGDRFLNKRNTALVPGFATLDAGIGYRWPRIEARLDGRNLTDARDAVSESEFGDAQYYRMPARAIQGSIAIRY